MTKLSDIPFEKIKTGLEIISAIGVPGIVTECIPEIPGVNNGARYDTVYMIWENGKRSSVFHMNADKITIK